MLLTDFALSVYSARSEFSSSPSLSKASISVSSVPCAIPVHLLALLGSRRMRQRVHLLELLDQDLGVDLRRVEFDVSERRRL